MKKLVLFASLLSLASAGAAMAQPGDHDRRDDRREDRQDHRDVRREVDRAVRRDVNRDFGRGEIRRGDERFVYRGQPYARFRGPGYAYPRGFAYRPWARGQFLPRAFFGAPYYVDNWSYYRLGPPLPGFRYIRVGPDILLVNVRTGLISETVPGVFY